MIRIYTKYNHSIQEVKIMTTKIFAHRGASMLAPENTMDSFELAYQMGAEGIETDVHLTKDKVPILIHDETINRTTNGYGYVKDYTFAQLQSLDAGSWFAKKYSGASLISLEEFLLWAKPKPFYLNIELKNNKIDYKHLETIVYEMLNHFEILDRTIISTFNAKSLQRMKKLNQQVDKALLTSKNYKNLIKRAIELDVNAVHIKYSTLKTKLVERANQEDIAIRVYTVNKPIKMIRCFARGCHGIFTDIPDRGLKYRKLYQNNYLGEST